MKFLGFREVRIGFLVLAALLMPGTASATEFYTLPGTPPCRLYDSREPALPSPPAPAGVLAANASRTVTVTGFCGVPADAVAVALNLTVAQPTASGNLSLYPNGATVVQPPHPSPQVAVASLSFKNGVNQGMILVVDLGTAGDLVAKNNSTGDLHFVIDVSGYFSARAPIITATAGTTSFTEDGGAVVVDSGITVADANSANLVSATVTIANPQDGASEVLGATNCPGLTVTPGLNSLSITGNQPVATYQTCLQSVTYDNSDQDPAPPPLPPPPGIPERMIVFVADDGTTSSNGEIKLVSVTAVNDAPVVTTTAGTTTFTEDGGAVVVDSGVTVTDVDNANLASATVTITNPQDGAAEVLAATNCAGLTITPGLNSLSITGSQPKATYQTCLQSVTYDNSSSNPDLTARVIAFVASDGAASSVAANKTVTIGAVDGAPVVTTTAGTTGFTEGGGAVIVDSGVTVTDSDSANLASATVTITNPQDGAAEVLGATSCAGLTVTPGLNSLSITGSQPLAIYQTCLQSVTYDNSSLNPGTTARVISFVANDGTTSSAAANKTVTIGAVNGAPVVTTTAGTTAFTEDGGAVVVDSGVTVTDADSANLASATVTITNPQDGAAEVLGATSCAGLTVTPGLNSLSITGSQPLATYQTCLQSVTYDNSSQNPDATARVISFVVNDGTTSSAAANKTVTVAAVDDVPVVTTTAGPTGFTEDGGAVVVDSGVTVTDADSANLASATVTITNPQNGAAEVLGATNCAGLTVTPGLNSLSITGSQPPATYQSCLQSVTYNNTSQNPGTTARVLAFVANDGTTSSAAANKTVTVAASNDAPVVTTTAGTTAFTEDGGAVVVDNGLTVTDADDVNLESATVSLAAAPDGASEVLSATSCAGLTVTPGNPLTISGSQPLAVYQVCLRSVTYNNTSQSPNTTNRTVSFVVNDGDNNSNTASKTLSVAASNDTPVVTTTAGITAFVEDAGAVVVDGGVTVTDADDVNLESATVSLVAAPDGASEVLSATSCAGLTVTPGNPLTITGSQPVAIYQTCLQSVTYNNASQAPNTANRTVNFVVNDGDNNSNTASKTVSVTSVNDLPVVTTTAGITSFTEDAGAVVVDNGLTVTDADDANLESATVSLAAAPNGASEVLSATSCAGLTVTPGNPLTITGSQPVAVYQTCLRSVTYNNASQNPDTTNRTVNFVVNDGDGNSNTAPKTVSVTAVNDPPTPTVNPVSYATAGNTQLHVEGKALAGVVSVADPQGVDTKAVAFTDPDGPVAPAIVNNDAGVSANGGSFDIDTDGSFTYVPPTGFTGTDSFTYQVTDTVTPFNATVNIVVTEMVWYVHDVVAPGNPGNPAAGDTGRSNNAFEDLEDVAAVLTDNDFIFVFRGNSNTAPHGGIRINRTGIKLHGEGVGLTVPGFGTLIPAGPQPFIDNAADVPAQEDHGVAVDATTASLNGVEIRGLVIEGRDNGIDVTAIAGNSVGLTISNNTITSDATTGLEGVDVNANGTGTVTVTVSNNSLNGRGNAFDARTGAASALLRIDLSDNANIFSNASGVVIDGAGGSNTTITGFANNSVHPNTGGTGISVNAATFDTTPGGSFQTVSGGTTLVGTTGPGNGVGAQGVVLTNVTGDLAFTDLDVFADNGAGLRVTGTGAVNTGAGTGTRVTVSSGVGIVEATGGPAVDINNATVDLQLMSLRSTTPNMGVSLVSVSDGTTPAMFSAGSGSSITASSGAGPAFNVSGGNAGINYGGTITNNGTGRAVSIATWAGDDASDDLLFSGAIDENGAGILLNANAGSRAITFSGGMDIDTTTGEGFAATSNTNSLGLHVTGTNTIDSISATALRVTNTTIGSSNLNFRTISSGNNTAAADPANGIVLNTTGTSGGLKVAGTGSAGSGGTIQRTTGVGVLLTSTAHVSLASMNVQNSGDDGIRGLTVTNLELNGCNLSTNGNATAENGLQLGEASGSVVGITGNLTLTNTNITASAGNNVHIRNTSGTLAAMNISGGSFNDLNDTTGANSFLFEMSGTAVTTAAAINGATFSNNSPQRGLEVQAHETGLISDFLVSGTTFNNNGIHVSFTQDTNSNLTFRMLNNTSMLNAAPLHAINVFSSSTSTGGSITGTIQGNVIGNASVGSGSSTGNGIRVVVQGRTSATLLIDGNTIRQTPGGRAIDMQFLGHTTSGLGIVSTNDVTLTNNNVQNNGTSFPLAAIFLAADNQGSPARVRADIRGNVVPATGTFDYPTFDGNAAQLIFEELTGATAELVDTPPASANATSQLTSTNTGTAYANGGVALIAGPINTP